jgi:hypothetical protein
MNATNRMQRGIDVRFTALAGALILAAGLVKPASAAPPPPLPTGYQDAGMSGGSGTTTVTGTGADARWDITAIGEDLGGTADQGYFVYASLPGDGGVTARVLAQSGGSTGGWAKNGVMLRESTDPGALMITFNYTSAGKNHANPQLEYLSRPKVKEATPGAGADRDLKNGPVWLRVQRQGQKFQALHSDDGQHWRVAVETTLTIDASKPVLAGLSASSQSKTVTESGTLDNVSISSDIIQPSPEGPSRVQVFPGNGRVLLTFSSVANATGYNIYRRAAGESADKAVLVNAKPTVNGWLIDDNAGKGLANGAPLIYTVRGVVKDAAGKPAETFDSQEVEVLPQVADA